MKQILITAHSGCEGTQENSLTSIEKGIVLGADCVEIDIRSDAEGRLWLTHDLPESVSGLVSLEEAFSLIQKSGISVNCDLKEYGALLPALALAEQCGIGPRQLIFSGSVDMALLEEMPEIAERSRIFLNSEVLVRDLSGEQMKDRDEQTAYLMHHAEDAAARLHALHVQALNAPYEHMPDELIDALRRRNVALSLWTLSTEEPLRQFMTKDLLNITTRSVSMALSVRRDAGRD